MNGIDLNLLLVISLLWLFSVIIVFFFVRQKYEKDTKELTLLNSKLEDEKRFLRESYELKLINQAKIFETKEQNLNEKIS